MKNLLLFLFLCAAPMAAAQEIDLKIPAEVAPFVEKKTKAIALEKADLNGDGTTDYVLVLEKEDVNFEDRDAARSSRPALIIVRNRAGKLSVAARNELVVSCRTCGGAYGDSFDSIIVARGGFLIWNTGGTRERWIHKYEFKYSRRAKAWRLSATETIYFDTSDTSKRAVLINKPSDFGIINFEDFDPEFF